jgi:hypothetical protein
MPKQRASTRLTLPSRIACRAPPAAEREDRAGGRAADAGQRRQRGEVAWEHAAVLVADDLLRGAMQVAGPGVVAEPRPQVQHLVDRRVGERTTSGSAA